MNFPFRKTISEEKETKMIAKEFSGIIKSGDIILLNGNLGSGKTFFVKSVLENFNIKDANSPTFAIVNEYPAGNIKFYHFDFYRINREYELYDIGIDDYLSDNDAITFIEWANLFPDVILNYTYEIKIEILPENKREIKIIHKH